MCRTARYHQRCCLEISRTHQGSGLIFYNYDSVASTVRYPSLRCSNKRLGSCSLFPALVLQRLPSCNIPTSPGIHFGSAVSIPLSFHLPQPSNTSNHARRTPLDRVTRKRPRETHSSVPTATVGTALIANNSVAVQPTLGLAALTLIVVPAVCIHLVIEAVRPVYHIVP